MRRRLCALAAAMLWLAAGAATAQEEPESPEVLPAGPGQEETFYACTGCHSSMLIRRQGMSRDRWDETIDWMIERHGMPEPDAQERELILDYLASNFAPKGGRPPSPFLSR